MGYRNVLVAVALSPDSQKLVNKAVSIVQPYNGVISLITLTTEPEMYNSYASPYARRPSRSDPGRGSTIYGRVGSQRQLPN
ncbi:universal stress protein UspC [Yersinia aldovae]|nr:universal stress protein UspC [Yersinia aldovae]